jgi:hypothetical protein
MNIFDKIEGDIQEIILNKIKKYYNKHIENIKNNLSRMSLIRYCIICEDNIIYKTKKIKWLVLSKPSSYEELNIDYESYIYINLCKKCYLKHKNNFDKIDTFGMDEWEALDNLNI